MNRPAIAHRSATDGFVLVEALIGILLFAISVISLVAFQGTAVGIAHEAKTRADAAFYANQIIARMWTDRTNLAAYALNANAAACAQASGANTSTHAPVQNWLAGLQGSGSTPGQLPSAADLRQQIVIGGANEVTVTVCWQHPSGERRNYVARSQIRFN
jgi:type IV pilus assembly protein PilV